MKVVDGYARTFSEIMNGNAVNLLICKNGGKKRFDKIKVIDISECDYSNSYENFNELKRTLVCKLKEVFESDLVLQPALVIGHNLNLCKNLALTAAFMELARQYKKVRFFSVMHDFAEEGRTDMLDKISEFQKAGIPVKDNLYCKNAPVKIVVPGINAFEILKKCGFNLSWVANPIFVSKNKSVPEKTAIRKSLQDYACQKGLIFDSEKPVFSYPVRIIPRKNILETIAFVTVLNSGNLLTGTYGTSERSKTVFNYAKQIVKEFKLPVIFNAFEVIKEIWNMEPTDILYAVSDLVVSSSVMEGFGYALYEPWLYGCGVTGRMPLGGGGYSKTIDISNMYSRFPVPETWVSVEQLREKYWIKYNKYYPKRGLSTFLDSIVTDKSVDFALLDEKMQFELIRSVLIDTRMRENWRCLLNKEHVGWPGMKSVSSPNRNIICKNMEKITSEFSYLNFHKLFYTSFVQPSKISFSSCDYSCILDEFSARGLWLLT